MRNDREHLIERIAALRAQAKRVRESAAYCERNADMRRELELADKTDRQADQMQAELDAMGDQP